MKKKGNEVIKYISIIEIAIVCQKYPVLAEWKIYSQFFKPSPPPTSEQMHTPSLGFVGTEVEIERSTPWGATRAAVKGLTVAGTVENLALEPDSNSFNVQPSKIPYNSKEESASESVHRKESVQVWMTATPTGTCWSILDCHSLAIVQFHHSKLHSLLISICYMFHKVGK